MRHVVPLLLAAGLLFLSPGCSGGQAGDPEAPPNQGGGVPPPGGGGNPGGSGGGGGTVPAVTFKEAAIDLGKAGAFPSDLVRDGQGRIVTVDDAQIPANVVAWSSAKPAGAPILKVPVTANDLVDHDGTTPARSVTAFGTGLFGAFTGDLEAAFGRWILLTVGAGNSVSDDGSAPLRLANLVVVDTLTSTVVQTVNLAWDMPFQGTFSNGGPLTTIPQSLPAMVAFVPDPGTASTGTVYVALSNGAGSSASLRVFYPGTIQAWRADFTAPAPIAPLTAGKAPLDVTRTFVTNHYNPVALTRAPRAGGHVLLVTSAGASQFGANGVIQPTTDAHLEFLDHDAAQWRDTWDITLGATLPAGHAVALGTDATGLRFGLLGSQTFAAVSFVDLSGLDGSPVDPAKLRLLRTVELEPGGSAALGSGYVFGAALSFTHRSAVLSRFDTSSLVVLGLPEDLEFGDVAVDPAPFDAAFLGPAQGLGLGSILIEPQAPVFFVVNGNFDANFLPIRNAFLGTLEVRDGLP